MGTREHVGTMGIAPRGFGADRGHSLTGPLPFDEDEFDHVRFTEVALGIPENKVRTTRDMSGRD